MNNGLTRAAGGLLALLALSPALVLGQSPNALGPEGNALYANPFPPADGRLFGTGMVSGDFDGDGIADLAVSENSGLELRVYFGRPWTVGTVGATGFDQVTVARPSGGSTMAAGDYDGDGRDEIALGRPGVGITGASSTGAVTIMNRLGNGTWSEQEEIRLGQFGYGGVAEQDDELGRSLAAGDFDGDGFVDLAIGLPGKTVGGFALAGRVMITYGSAAGITSVDHRFYDRNTDFIDGAPEADDRYGFSLASADFDNDGFDDLAIGVFLARCVNGQRGGGVAMMRGASLGVSTARGQWLQPGANGVDGQCLGAGGMDGFGTSLHAGAIDFNLNDDLIVGAPFSRGGGAVAVFYGDEEMVSTSDEQIIRGEDLSVPTQTGSRFGIQVAIGNFRAQAFGARSLVVGASYDPVNSVEEAGSVWVIHAQANRLDPASGVRGTSGTSGTASGAPQTFDVFGSTLAVGDYNDDGLEDLAIGIPRDDEAAVDGGAIQVIYQSGFIFRNGFD
ncbi:MAG: VCBS repeat-containing protein [Dokdonella sp.]